MRTTLICLLFFATNAAVAENCSLAVGDPNSKTCIQVHTLTIDEVMALQIAPPRTQFLSDDVPWIAQAGVPPPLEVKPGDSGASMKTSLGQWRDFNSQMLARRIDEAKAMKAGLPQPKAATIAPSPFELWTTVDLQGLDQAAGNAFKTGVGADYKLTKTTVFGIAAERADTKPVATLGSQPATNAANQDDKLAAHLTVQPFSFVSIDAKTQHETGTAGTGRIDNNSVSIAPKLKYPFAVGSGQTLEPFVTVKDELIRGTTSSMVDGTKNAVSAGTGVTLTKPGNYSMSVTADVENMGAVEPANYKSRFQVSVPLK
jgi:hypothetical protein